VSEAVIQVAAKALIINDEGKVLVLREPAKDNPGSQDGLYGSVGGRMDVDEDYYTALHREVFEETGLKIEPLDPIHISEWHPTIKGVKCHIVGIFTVCRAKTNEVKLSFEHDDYKWIDPKDANKHDIMPDEAEAFHKLVKWLEKNG
jgi:8-oxo-dGTP diphosphatase